jgi:hypothetical protein
MSRSAKLALALAVLAVVLIPVAAVASHQFTDVPDSNIFHDDIAWMRDNNVTRGCNPPANDKYCPGNTVTREQMAAFMHRLATNKVVDAATAEEAEHATTADSATKAVDADTVDGFDAAELASRAAFALDQLDGVTENTTLDTTIVAPSRGVLVMNAAVDITLFTADTEDTVICELMVDGLVVVGTEMFASVGNNDGGTVPDSEENICSTTGALVVDPGSHTVTFDIRDVTDAELYDVSLNAIWVPFDGQGAVPAAVAAQADTGGDEK